ncbi:MAG: hypothetical protein HRU77_15110 [Gammaproteobacteria bacterium]|nr:MAG: hypothetical protein HRU77_15110 [Gammaproteobacteria bacterium]
MSAELANFADFIGLDTVVPNRYSILLVLGLFGGFKSKHLNPANVMHEIKALEGIGTSSQMKPATPFKHPPLKGLDRYGIPLFKERILEAQEAGKERYVSIEDCKLLADDIVQGNWMRLANTEALTGQWIVYAQYEGKNYYLCLGMHDSGDHNLRNQIGTICCQEFPFLTTLLT